MAWPPPVPQSGATRAGSVVHSGDMIDGDGGQHTLRIDLRRLPESVECLFLTMSSFAGAKLCDVEQPYIW
jgi:stress response protein SCP2